MSQAGWEKNPPGAPRVVFLPKIIEERCRIGRPCTFYFKEWSVYVECRLVYICSVHFHAYTVLYNPHIETPNGFHQLKRTQSHILIIRGRLTFVLLSTSREEVSSLLSTLPHVACLRLKKGPTER
jgi:hypothetical protein